LLISVIEQAFLFVERQRRETKKKIAKIGNNKKYFRPVEKKISPRSKKIADFFETFSELIFCAGTGVPPH
jgi:hypothetical protein